MMRFKALVNSPGMWNARDIVMYQNAHIQQSLEDSDIFSFFDVYKIGWTFYPVK